MLRLFRFGGRFGGGGFAEGLGVLLLSSRVSGLGLGFRVCWVFWGELGCLGLLGFRFCSGWSFQVGRQVSGLRFTGGLGIRV